MNTATDTQATETTDDNAPTFAHSATYSPEDNKLRIYPGHRLSAEDYARVKAAGFSWAPKQEIFVAPMWTPAREDLAREFCGEIGDEDTTLCERSETRADRFDGYQANRRRDAHQAHDYVRRIADGIPMGQPILVGHHSQRHAERDARRIEQGMRRAVDMWDTADYWKRRAAGAIRHARYKERPDVRARRIKGIEADQRKLQKTVDQAAAFVRMWETAHDDAATKIKRKDGAPTTFLERAKYIANHDRITRCFPLADYPRQPPASQYEGPMSLWSALEDGILTPEQAQRIAINSHNHGNEHRARWLAHYANRLEYERAMLAEGGGIVADRFNIEPGGMITHRGRRSVVLKLNREGNRKDGRLLSLTVTGQSWTVGLEEVTDYEPPTAELAEAAAKVTKLAPLCNYDHGEGKCARMTEAQYKELYAGAKMIRPVKATETHEAHRVRTISGYKSREFGGPNAAGYDQVPVFLTDAKVKPAPVIGGEPPKPRKGRSMARKIAEAAGVETAGTPEPEAKTAQAEPAARSVREIIAEATAPTLAEVRAESERLQRLNAQRAADQTEAAPFDAMRQALRSGTPVQVVSAPQLFPTPRDVAQRMADLAGVEPGQRVLEPSAGTGALLGAIGGAPWVGQTHGPEARRLVHAVEVNHHLAARLDREFPLTTVHRADFLTLTPDDVGGLFDVILMNPPFANGADMRHIEHALGFLAPGGRLVAICAAGPRQHEAMQKWADSWEYLEPGTFDGTNVRAVLMTYTRAD